jgi:hypothetical protein
MAREGRSEPVLLIQRKRAFGFELGCCHGSFLCCNLFISGTDYGMRGGVLFILVKVEGLFVFFGLIYLSQALFITHIVWFLDCSGHIFYLFIVV